MNSQQRQTQIIALLLALLGIGLLVGSTFLPVRGPGSVRPWVFLSVFFGGSTSFCAGLGTLYHAPLVGGLVGLILGLPLFVAFAMLFGC